MNATRFVSARILGISFLLLLSATCEEKGPDREKLIEQAIRELTVVLQENIKSSTTTLEAPNFANHSLKPQAEAATTAAATLPTSVLDNYANNGYSATTYKGAIDPAADTPWYDGWSFYAHIVANQPDKKRNKATEEEIITDATLRQAMQANNNQITWTKDKLYVLDGFVFVQETETLTIEAGTVVVGRRSDENSLNRASALIIARGGQIMAEGTKEAPIIFTFHADPLDGTTTPTTRGRWGGLIVLGHARLNSQGNQTAIEGIPTGESRALYGGNDDADNSGVLRYVSIRHGGSDIGAGNEINGLTLGGVGSQTTLQYIEVVGNRDDGIEFFGGTATCQYVISAMCADDAIDYDEGYRGFNQYVIIAQDPADGGADNGLECDGGTEPESGTPLAQPLFVNLTAIGNARSRIAVIRDNAGGHFYNSIFVNFGQGINIEFLYEIENDAWQRYENQELSFTGNVFSNIDDGAITEIEKIFELSSPDLNTLRHP